MSLSSEDKFQAIIIGKQSGNTEKNGIVGSAMSMIAFAESFDNSWGFTGSNQPFYRTLDTDDVHIDKVGCNAWIDNMYENYARLHPGFRPLMSDAAKHRRWREALILRGGGNDETFNHCSNLILLRHFEGGHVFYHSTEHWTRMMSI